MQRYHFNDEYSGPHDDGNFVTHVDHLAALAAETAKREEAEAKVPKWVGPGELPEEYERTLSRVVRIYDHVDGAQYEGYFNFHMGVWKTIGGTVFLKETTSWMPLPTPPEVG